MNKEIASIYFIRLFAMLMVVFVHVTAQYRHLFDISTVQHRLYHFFNNFVRVEAGMFVMIIGIVFFYNYRNRPFTIDVLLAYWKKRVVYILIPYVVWSLIYEVEAFYYQDRMLVLREVGLRLLNGESKYQLYFIFIVVQFYLIFPLLIIVIRRFPLLKKYLWLIGLVIEFIYFKSSFRDIVQVPFFLQFISPFLLGGWIGLYYEEIIEKLRKWKMGLAGIGFVLAGSTYVWIRYENAFIEAINIPLDLYKSLGIAFLFLGSLYFFYFSEYLVKASSDKTIHRLRSVAYYSFGYYLMHPLVMFQVMKFIPTRIMPIPWHVTIFLQYLLTVVLCYFIIWSFHRFVPFASFIFGKLPKKAQLVWQIKE